MPRKQRILVGYLWVTLLAAGACAAYFAAEIRATGIATRPLVTAASMGALAFALGALSLRSVGRAAPSDLGFLAARYLRIVFSLNVIVFVAVLFGKRSEAVPRLAAHLLGAMAVHRAALLWPAALSRALAALGRSPIARAAEVLVFNVCATLVFAEVVLRAHYAGSPREILAAQREHPRSRKLDQELFFGAAPNSLGYNDEEFSSEKRAGTTRIAAIGDSFFVASVPRALGVIDRTEALLRQHNGAVQIDNFGILGSNIDDYEIALEEDALAFHPDAVLLGIYIGNDLRISTMSATFRIQSYAIHRALEDIRRHLEARRLERTGAFRDVTQSALPLSGTPTGPTMTWERYLKTARRELPFYLAMSSREVARAWHDSLASLERFAATCRAHGVPLLVVIHPSHSQVSPAMLAAAVQDAGIDLASLDVAIPQRRLLDFFAQRNIPALDLLPAFQRAAHEHDPDEFYLLQDTHWSVPGNEIAALELAAFLTSRLR